MKLHLPTSLRKVLLVALCATAAGVSFTANGASMSTLVTQTTYCDFGDNAGQYAVHGVNALLQHIRDEDEGVFIYYTKEGMAPYNILVNEGQELISFESRTDQGPAAGIGYNFIATVEHNGRLSASFTGTKIGAGNAIQYASIEYNVSSGNVFCLTPRTDYKIARLSKVITDVSTYGIYTEACSTLNGQMRYRSGSGTFYRVDEANTREQVGGAYTFNIAGIMKVDSASNYSGTPEDCRGITDDSGSILNTTQWWRQADIENNRPLPYAAQPGDSGSPTWIYDTETQTYLYAGAMQSANYTTLSQARYAGQWTRDTMEYFDCTVNAESGQTLHITAVNKAEESRTSTVNGGAVVTSHPYSGTVTGGADGTVSFIGVREGSHTWNDLAGVKDNPNWYAYGNSYLAASTEDLFYTNNLVFHAAGAGEHNVVLDATVDTGVGYTRFSCGTVDGDVAFNLSAAGSQNYQLDTAGFVVDAGVSLHMKLSGESGRVREWRKTGEGDLYLEGSGDNSNILLNLGGSGTTYLQQQGNNCAAYNVLANNGTHVVINGINQIKKDFTFGYGGATLDMNGLSMTWNNGSAAGADGFTIHALTDEARIVNGKAGSTVRLMWTQGGTQEYLGSFVESETGGALQFIYAGGDNAKLTLHSIYTDLGNGTGEGGKDGGVIVQSGTLALQGTLTQHAPGSKGVAYSTAAYSHADDWHYADMKAPVKVEGGAFELGSHARLTGDVSVEDGGTFIVRESVCHQMEYLEGGYTLKDTDAYRAYFGHHGSVSLNGSGAKMEIAFGDTADSTLVYGNSISGSGSLLVNPGIKGGDVHLAGDNSGLTGARSLVHAGLVFDRKEAVGDLSTQQWKVSDSGFIVVNDALLSACDGNALKAVTHDSTGALALMQDSAALALDNYQGLYIGAYKDCVVQYGTQGTTDELAAQSGAWRLGGGGGELVVNYVLAGDNDLVLGDTLSQGTVRLTNTSNSFSGQIIFKGGVTLAYDSDAVLGNASFSINYTNRVAPGGGLAKIESDSDGVLLLDPLTQEVEGRRVLTDNLDLTAHSKLAIGSSADMEYCGNISVAANADYSFGGSTALMTVQNALAVNGANGLLVDGQTYTGGEIRLKSASQITGDVVVRGCNPAQLPLGAVEGGSITLGLDANNALAQTSSVTIEKGGILDLRGTSQQFKNLEVKAGGALVSSSGAHTGEVSFSMDRNITWNGSSSVGAIRVTGSGTLTLSAADGAHYDELHMGSGTALSLGTDNVLSATGTTYIEQGASLFANGHKTDGNIVLRGNMNAEASSFSGVVTLENGNVSFRNGSLDSTGTLVSSGGTISGYNGKLNGSCYILAGTTTFSAKNTDGSMTQGSGISAISGTVEISNGATLKLEYGSMTYPPPLFVTVNCEYAISSAEFNTATPAEDEEGRIIPNGTLFADTNVLELTGGNQNFGGTVKIGNHNTAISNNGGTKTFDNFELTGGTTTVNGSGVSWSIAHLNGKGTLNANINQRLSLAGEGTFNGTLVKTAGSLLLGHESAAAAAEVRLDGGASLVLDADKVRVRALGTSGSGTSITANNRNATLEIAPAESSAYTYAGSVTGDAAHGVSLLMSGTGTQTFSGADIKLQNVSVQAGTLAFTNETAPTIYGDVGIARGGTLDFNGKSLLLSSGQSLNIADGEGVAATFNGNLAFAGGKMLFDSGILSEGTSVLSLTGTASLQEGTAGLVVDFSNDGALENKTYLLSTGNWEGLAGKIASDSLIYHTADFAANASGLSVTISERSDIQVWNGAPGQSEWNSNRFGQDVNNLSQASTAVFNDTAASTDVSVTSTVQVKELVFDNDTRDYSVNTGAGAGVTAQSLRQVGSGNTDIAGNVQVATAAVLDGTLSLGSGVSVGSVSVDAAGAVVLKDTDAVSGTISGGGTVRVDWGADASGSIAIGSINTVEVKSGTLNMTGQTDGQMEKLHVMEGGSFRIDARAGNYTTLGIVDQGGTLEMVISDKEHSAATVTRLEGQGTMAFINESRLDLGDNPMTGTKMDATGFTGTIRLGNGTEEMRLKSSRIQGVGSGVTIELNDETQYWVDDNNSVVNANLVIHGQSGASQEGSWNNEGFGAVRAASTFNGDVTIDGNALVSGANSITFNAAIKGYNDNDTLTFGLYRNSNSSYTLSSGADATTLANMVVRTNNGNYTTTVNVNSAKGLADNLQFADGTGAQGVVNVNASNAIERLESASGDGVVNIAQGAALALNQGAEFGGTVNLGSGSVTVTTNAAESVFQAGSGVKFSAENDGFAAVSGNGATRLDNACIQVQEGNLLMSGMVLGANSAVAGGASSSLAADNLVIEGQLNVNVETGAARTLAAGSVLTAFGGSAETVTLQAATTAAMYVLNNVQDVALTGECLTIDLSATGQAPLSGEWMGITLGGASHTATLGTGLLVECIMGNGQKLQGYYLSSSGASGASEYVFFKGEEIVAGNLIWDHSKNTNWSTKGTDLNWHTADQPEKHQAFTVNSNVTFESETCSLNLTENIAAGTMTLESGANVTINGGGFTQELDSIALKAGSQLSFSAGSNTVADSVALNGTLTNNGELSIGQGSVSAAATGVLAGTGETTLSGTILNTGTLVLAHANLKGESEASITGNVIISGGTLGGTMSLGSAGSTVAVTEVFNMAAGASYTIEGNLVLDDLELSVIWYDGATYDIGNNGFIDAAYVTIYNGDSDEEHLALSEGATVTYKGMPGSILGNVFMNDGTDYTTFYVNTEAEQGAETYSVAKETAELEGHGTDFKNLKLFAGTGFEMDEENATLEKVTAHGSENAASLYITENASIDSVEVETGILNILNNASVDVKDVTIGANATLGVYKGLAAPDIPATENEDTLTIKDGHSLIAKGAGATLNANLVMQTGSTLDVSATGGEGLTLGSSLILQENVNLSDADLEAVAGLGYGERYILFNGVDSLTLDRTYTGDITPDMKIDAAGWFRGVDADHIYMVYDGSNVGLYCMVALPEPTTSTLSLLALAAFAARRRRK